MEDPRQRFKKFIMTLFPSNRTVKEENTYNVKLHIFPRYWGLNKCKKTKAYFSDQTAQVENADLKKVCRCVGLSLTQISTIYDLWGHNRWKIRLIARQKKGQISGCHQNICCLSEVPLSLVNLVQPAEPLLDGSLCHSRGNLLPQNIGTPQERRRGEDLLQEAIQSQANSSLGWRPGYLFPFSFHQWANLC